MKKRFLSIILALALCVGLTVPAFAASQDYHDYIIGFAMPSGDGSLPPQVTASYQIRAVSGDIIGGYAYDAVRSSSPIDAYVLPLDASIRIRNLRLGNLGVGGQPTDFVAICAYSDSDYDGIYDMRIFYTRGQEISVVPLTERGPFVSTNDVVYTDSQSLLSLGVEPELDSATYSMTITTDQLCDLFGSNTLLVFFIVEETSHMAVTSFSVLLTGKSDSPFTDVPAGSWYAGPVAWAVEKGITNSTGANTFSPNNNCKHSEILTFLWRAAGKPDSQAESPIVLHGNEYYARAVRWAAEKEMIDSTFDPDAPCTRAEAVTYIWKAFDKPSAKASRFTDVDAQADYAGAVSWAVEKGVTQGTGNTTFSPNQVCTRAHIVTFLYRAYK